MAARKHLIHTVSTSPPISASLGDEWYDPSTNSVYKCLAVDGTKVEFKKIATLSEEEVSDLPLITVSDSPPAGVSGGSLWWNSSSGQLYVYYNDGDSSQWVVTSKGPVGPKGDTGTAATIAAGTVTTVPPGSPAAVTNVGTSSSAIFNFDIPKGDTGDPGQGVVGGGTDRAFIENDNTITTSYTITTNRNAMTVGPITINDGATVTVPTGGRWIII